MHFGTKVPNYIIHAVSAWTLGELRKMFYFSIMGEERRPYFSAPQAVGLRAGLRRAYLWIQQVIDLIHVCMYLKLPNPKKYRFLL